LVSRGGILSLCCFLFVGFREVTMNTFNRLRSGVGQSLRRSPPEGGGDPPLAPGRGSPCRVPGRGGRPGRRAPARGVDVKPPAGPGLLDPKKGLFGVPDPFSPSKRDPEGVPSPLKTPKQPKKAYNTPFWGILAIFGVSGLFLGSRGGCFYINPSRRGPVPHFWEDSAGRAPEGLF